MIYTVYVQHKNQPPMVKSRHDNVRDAIAALDSVRQHKGVKVWIA